MDKKLRSNFEKLLDRKASDEEIKHLYHVKNTLGIRDNDSLWLILMTLESYNSLYKRYPAMMSAECDKVLRKQKDHLETIAEAETKKYLSKLTESVTDTAKHIAGRQSDAMLLLSWGWFFAALTVFGALCVMVGYVVGTGKVRFPRFFVFQGRGSCYQFFLALSAQPRLQELLGRLVAQCGVLAPAVVKNLNVFKAGDLYLVAGLVAHTVHPLVLEAVEPALHGGIVRRSCPCGSSSKSCRTP